MRRVRLQQEVVDIIKAKGRNKYGSPWRTIYSALYHRWYPEGGIV